MKKKTLKILITILTVTMMVLIFANTCLAATDALVPSSITPATTGADQEIQTFGGKLLGILTTVGIVASVIVLAILGIKYMMGSAEEKADYKKSFIPYIVGAIILFAAPTIANIIYNFAK